VDGLVQVEADHESVVDQAGSNELHAPSHDISKGSPPTGEQLLRTPNMDLSLHARDWPRWHLAPVVL